MITERYPIEGCDFEGAGMASRRLKEHLKKIGVNPKAIRRAIIAAYEAEMNVVIYAYRGAMEVTFLPGCIDVHVSDEGPGIPDVPRAMEEGFSTASAEVRALGFGAGMGLPNIQRNSDHFAISSELGKGTDVHFTVHFEPERIGRGVRHSIAVEPERCHFCLRCLNACPTAATRVRPDGPQILEHLCIDCTACLGVCEPVALGLRGIAEVPTPASHTVLLVPDPILFQFGFSVGPEAVLKELSRLGFKQVRLLGAWDRALREAVLEQQRLGVERRPLISPVCPAVVNLIETRFPVLIEHLAPFLSPVEAALTELDQKHTICVVSCPSQRTNLEVRSMRGKVDITSARNLLGHLLPGLSRGTSSSTAPVGWADQAPETPREILRVSGLGHVLNLLDSLENGYLHEVPVVEPYACDQGCFGSPLYRENAFVAGRRAGGTADLDTGPARAIRREAPFSPRQGMRLDEDMARAVIKLSEIDRLIKRLPGRDCGACGSPSCAALAEDVVLGRVSLTACVYLPHEQENSS